mmetsp:Transcript_15597/g.33807  ORF Transcript_15597/g.33807 Transcript_15597/m.33807 type:complete len:276 (+) Transcript_15597:2216-3043(+)
MPARRPRPKSSAASCGLLYSGFTSRLVSSLFSQSKLNRNLSLGLTIRFFCFFSPRYWILIPSSSFSRSRSSWRSRRAASRCCDSMLLRCHAVWPARSPLRMSSTLFLSVSAFSFSFARAAASLCALVMNTGFASAAACSCRFFSSSSRDKGCFLASTSFCSSFSSTVLLSFFSSSRSSPLLSFLFSSRSPSLPRPRSSRLRLRRRRVLSGERDLSRRRSFSFLSVPWSRSRLRLRLRVSRSRPRSSSRSRLRSGERGRRSRRSGLRERPIAGPAP